MIYPCFSAYTYMIWVRGCRVEGNLKNEVGFLLGYEVIQGAKSTEYLRDKTADKADKC